MALKLKNPQFKRLTDTPQKRTYTVAFATLILVAVMVFFAIRPVIVSIFDRRSENESKQGILDKMDSKQNDLLQLNSQSEEYYDELYLLDSVVPENRDEDFLVANLQAICDENDVVLVSMSISKNIAKSVLPVAELGRNIEVSGINLGLKGSRNDIRAVIEDLEAFPRIINLYNLSISASGGEFASSGLMNASIEAEIYYYD